MAVATQLTSPALRPAKQNHSSSSSSSLSVRHLSVPGTKLPRQRCQSIALRLRKRDTSLRPKCLGASQSKGDAFPSSPLTNLVLEFYDSLNNKDMKKLNKLLDSNCVFEDLAFPSPFKGKQVNLFLEELSTAMGQNVRFRIDDVYQEGNQNAGARWHIEWKDYAIPFTKGCSFFYCSDNPQLLIKKACVFTESPVKPGAVVVELLRFITSFFDKYPKMAVWFLEKPHALFQFLLKIYKIFLEPLILPLLVYYTHVWTYAARLLSIVLNLVMNILKPFM